MRALALFCTAAFSLIAVTASAQDAALTDRITRLERDITFLQRQIYRGASVDPNAPAAAGGSAVGMAQMQTQLAQLQEEVRQVRGSVEQAQFQARRAQDELAKLSEDVEFRLQALEKAQAERLNPPSGEEHFSPDAGKEDAAVIAPHEAEPAKEEAAAYTPPQEAKASTASAVTDAADAHYNNAFAMLNRKQYAQAAESFTAFIRQYPSDPLVPNAYYWLGESHYARGDYVRAIEQFRKGYEAAPSGQKAADNLLKLGLSLSNVKRKEEACVVLQQVVTKFKGSATAATTSRADQARAQLKCI